MSLYQRGSEWRQWDLHIHTPASLHWTGAKFEDDINSENNKILVDKMIVALNSATPAVFAIMDYWTFDGWFALKRRLKEPGAPKLEKTVFPGIELRLMAPMSARLNAHVLFSDKITDQELNDFKSVLLVETIGRPLSNHSLTLLARAVGEDILQKRGFKKIEVDNSDEVALIAGSTIAEINVDSYKKAIAKVPNGQAIGFMPYDTSDGLAGVKWENHYAFFLTLFRSSPIFESRNSDLRDCFVGEVTEKNRKFIGSFQSGLGNVPRLVVAGSDAHCFTGTPGDNDRRGYGDFPSSKATWIKADPTFQGLLQAIMEPAKRSFIGIMPPKLSAIDSNKTSFIDRIDVCKSGLALTGTWLDGAAVPLNSDLVAIIGNKGSGKSALADVIALVGNSKQNKHFSFLKKDRFRGKSGDPAKHFDATLTWKDSSIETRNLNDDAPHDKVELIRYIPQGHFEELCNGHVAGTSNAFEKELRAVIFAHADDTVRLGALDFDQLVDQQEGGFRQKLEEVRKDLRRINQEIVNVEADLQPEVRDWLLEQQKFKERQVSEHEKILPVEVPKPDESVSPEQLAFANRLEVIEGELNSIDNASKAEALGQGVVARKQKALQNLRERIQILKRSFANFIKETANDLEYLGIEPAAIISLEINYDPIQSLEHSILAEHARLQSQLQINAGIKENLAKERTSLRDRLGAPQQVYQQYIQSMNDWSATLAELNGTLQSPNSLEGVKERIRQLDLLPVTLHELRERRISAAKEIYEVLVAQREARKRLFKPVQDLIQANELIRDEYKLEFQAVLGGSADLVATPLFSMIKQNSGEFRGEDESNGVIRKLTEECDFDTISGMISFVEQLHDKLQRASHSSKGFGINNLLRKDRVASEVYDLLFGLAYLEPRYSLRFQQAQIEQLSPGQRGALLLIFYLLVDSGVTPIILDQPEENLDNETVVNLLVPVLTEAKSRRQIIMVTHNPNLAVVCDAEQIIWSVFDRQNSSKITYLSGSIENPLINNQVVNVLEGTMRAFSNRSNKYFDS